MLFLMPPCMPPVGGRCAGLCAALLLWLCCSAESAKTAGFNWVAEGFEGPFSYDAPESIASIALARAAGINSFSLSFPWYVSSINSTGPICESVAAGGR